MSVLSETLYREATEDDNNVCAPVATSVVTGVDLDEVMELYFAKGRVKGRGVATNMTLDILEEMGFASEWIDPSKIIKLYPGVHGKLKNVTTHHPKRFNKVWPVGAYLLRSRGHISAVVDGRLHDWAEGRSLRVNAIYKITRS